MNRIGASGGEFEHVAVQCVSQELEGADIARCRLVCKLWRWALDGLCEDQVFWQRLSAREGISLVDGPKRNYYEDFKVLYPATISGRRICRLLESVTGRSVRFIGEIPRIRVEIFDLFIKSVDRYGKGNIRDNFMFIEIPSEIEITCSGKSRLTLDEQGNLIKVSGKKIEEQKRRIFFSLTNFKILCSLDSSEASIFHSSSNDDVIRRCGSALRGNCVYLVRKSISEETRGLPFDGVSGQLAFVKNKGSEITDLAEFKVTSLLVRVVFDAVFICGSKTFPDVKKTYARCCNSILAGNEDHLAVVGSFWPSSTGSHVYSTPRNSSGNHIGVAPCVLAGVSATSVCGKLVSIEKEL